MNGLVEIWIALFVDDEFAVVVVYKEFQANVVHIRLHEMQYFIGCYSFTMRLQFLEVSRIVVCFVAYMGFVCNIILTHV